MQCEICGNTIREAHAIELDGALLKVCGGCSRLGRPAREVPSTSSIPKPTAPKSTPKPITDSWAPELEEVELRNDYAKVIKQAREKASISQEELAKRMNEKLSVIKHLETGKLKPDDILAKKIEHTMKIQLFIPADMEE